MSSLFIFLSFCLEFFKPIMIIPKTVDQIFLLFIKDTSLEYQIQFPRHHLFHFILFYFISYLFSTIGQRIGMFRLLIVYKQIDPEQL